MTTIGRIAALGMALAISSMAAAQQKPKPPDPYSATQRGIMVREAVLYLAPDTSSAKLANIGRGREVAIFESSRGWLHVLASVTRERDVTGWLLEKGVIRPSTPNGDLVLYGEAVNSESEASRRRGRKGAAEDAFRLYSRMAEYFPQSPRAGEALYRAADIRWQVEREETFSRPSAKERDPLMRHQIDETLMKQVMKKYPHTRWDDLAAFHLLDNKICGDWQGQSKCPEKESELYEKYAAEHPQSPAAPEALYNAASRQAALIEIYKTEGHADRSAKAKSQAAALAQKIIGQYGQSDWGPRAQTLLYFVEQNIPTYGNAVD